MQPCRKVLPRWTPAFADGGSVNTIKHADTASSSAHSVSNKTFYMTGNQQRVITVAFLSPGMNDPWENRLTAAMSTHPFCHAELYFESINQSFSIQSGEKAGFRTKNLSNPNYNLVSLLVSNKEYDASLEFCRTVSSQDITFDERGMWLSWFPSAMCCATCQSNSQTRGKTFCSKIITEAMQFAGFREVEHIHPSATTPSDLYACMRGSRRIACNSVPFKRHALMMTPIL